MLSANSARFLFGRMCRVSKFHRWFLRMHGYLPFDTHFHISGLFSSSNSIITVINSSMAWNRLVDTSVQRSKRHFLHQWQLLLLWIRSTPHFWTDRRQPYQKLQRVRQLIHRASKYIHPNSLDIRDFLGALRHFLHPKFSRWNHPLLPCEWHLSLSLLRPSQSQGNLQGPQETVEWCHFWSD